MQMLKTLFTGTAGVLHHAYVIEGEKDVVKPALMSMIKHAHGSSLADTGEIWEEDFVTFGIDEAKELRTRSSRILTGKCAYAVVSAERFTHEAQNALLKTLEEPVQEVYFFFILPSAAGLLPTVLSRVALVRTDVAGGQKDTVAETFFSANYARREALLRTLIEEKDREGARVFLSALRNVVQKNYRTSRNTDIYATSVRVVERCRTHLSGRAPSVKMLLEYLALTLPRV